MIYITILVGSDRRKVQPPAIFFHNSNTAYKQTSPSRGWKTGPANVFFPDLAVALNIPINRTLCSRH